MLAATLKELEECDACVRCDEHREIEIPDDGGEESEHDPAECSCNTGKLCASCKLVAERDLARADLQEILAGVRRLIERNGYCVVCDKYAPWHLIDCPMLRHK